MKPFDIHCHLYDDAFEPDREQVIADARKLLAGIILAGEGPDSNRAILDLCAEHKHFLYPGLGLHPCELHKLTRSQIEAELEFIRAQTPVAISEIGMDYKCARALKELQKEIFIRLLKLAAELDVPAIVHSRWAVKPVCELIKQVGYPRVVLHGFTGTLAQAEQMIKFGCKISLSTSLLYSPYQQDYARKFDLEHFFLETDAPVMSPVRGRRNVPSNLILVVRKLAEIKGVQESEVVRITNENVKNWFGL